jgi:hypothetical protein
VVLLLVAAGLALRQHTGRNASTATGTLQCPTRPPTVHLPAGTDGGILFARPIAAMAACSYLLTMRPRPTRQARLTASVPLDHQLATRLAHDLNTAATTPNDPLLCGTVLSFSVLVARDDHGTAFSPITLTPGCRQITATNGTTTRYSQLTNSSRRSSNACDPHIRDAVAEGPRDHVSGLPPRNARR